MVLKRVIPCLDVDAGRVVKGTNFVGLRDAGDPVELAERYDAEAGDDPLEDHPDRLERAPRLQADGDTRAAQKTIGGLW